MRFVDRPAVVDELQTPRRRIAVGSESEGPGGVMRFLVLGPVEVECDGVTRRVGGPQQRRLLGVLLVRGTSVSSRSPGRRAVARWRRPEGAARSVMTYVSRLRAVLGDRASSHAGSGYRLDAAMARLDLDEFEALIDEAESVASRSGDRLLRPGTGSVARDRRTASSPASGGRSPSRRGSRRCDSVAREERAAALIALGHQTGPSPTSKASSSSIRCASAR